MRLQARHAVPTDDRAVRHAGWQNQFVSWPQFDRIVPFRQIEAYAPADDSQHLFIGMAMNAVGVPWPVRPDVRLQAFGRENLAKRLFTWQRATPALDGEF